ncbi:MAG: restriction endonuclease [Euryarchaeota archaeon CG01_land_8_20_14_3_00_38_12]|nr:MAG: restriction endonuclease [Euryarchaeota archaeon CG01_land_8_20_14_3_00_38_12]PJB20906.1 MAG: restriction endonuclease [Euryarchaeota archaeon CG_4_9_14_3_um_filter_38_12]
MKIKIKMNELAKIATNKNEQFPKYVSPIINDANKFSQGTRPKVVGKLSEMIQQCPYKTYEGWEKWYLSKKPDAIDNATKKIVGMLENFKEILPKIDEKTVRKWVEDLVLVKTFVGLNFQEAILKKLSSMTGKNFRLAESKEESEGIDGFIGEISISIKPETYKTKPSLMEKIKADKIIFYEKKKDGIIVDITSLSEVKQLKLPDEKTNI